MGCCELQQEDVETRMRPRASLSPYPWIHRCSVRYSSKAKAHSAWLLLLIVLFQYGWSPRTEAADPAVLAPCTIEGLDRRARCGVFEVAENPRRPKGRTIGIHAVVVSAAGPARSDPVVVLMGGPGEDAISVAREFADMLSALLADRDLLFIDQRGTGRSGALRCNLYSAADPATSLRDLFPANAVRECASQLAARADLTQYGYTNFAADLEHVRQALGYGPLNLFAGSYGTRAAQVFLRAYPQSVRTVYLGSVVPLDLAIPLPNARNTEAALQHTFDACAADTACQAAFPELRAEFRQIVARLDAGNVRVAVPGSSQPAALGRGRVIEWLRSRLYRPTTAAEIPWLIHRAYLDDWMPIANDILAGARAADSALSLGLLFSITCSEDLAFVRERDIQRESAGTALGDYRIRQQLEACRHWPKVAVPASYRKPLQSAVPAMFVSGDFDAATPLWFTQRVAPGFFNRHEVIHTGRGHTEWSECTRQLYQQFVAAGGVRGVEKSVCEAGPAPSFKVD